MKEKFEKEMEFPNQLHYYSAKIASRQGISKYTCNCYYHKLIKTFQSSFRLSLLTFFSAYFPSLACIFPVFADFLLSSPFSAFSSQLPLFHRLVTLSCCRQPSKLFISLPPAVENVRVLIQNFLHACCIYLP